MGGIDGDGGDVGVARTPVLMAPAVTPLYGNHPAFRIVTYDGACNGGGIGEGGCVPIDYDTHTLNYDGDSSKDPSWSKLYTFSETYDDATDGRARTEGLTAETYRFLARAMEDVIVEEGELEVESPAFLKFRSLYRSGAGGFSADKCDAACRDAWMCSIRSASSGSYSQCASRRSRARGEGFMGIDDEWLYAAVVTMIAAMACLGVLCCRRIRLNRRQYTSPPSFNGDAEVEATGLGNTGNDGDDDSAWSPYDKSDPEGPRLGTMT